MAEAKKDAKNKRPTAQKRIIQSKKREMKNRIFNSTVKTAIRSLQASPSQEKLNSVYSLVDKGVKKGVVKANKASRVKSKLQKKLSAQAK